MFLLEIRNDHTDIKRTQCLPETVIHRRIIEMYKCRDEFQMVDLDIRTPRTLSGTTRVDIANALQHMRSKGKKLRRLSADIDYVDPSVHEFVLLNCLLFEEIQITSNPEERTGLSVGIAMSIRHALTSNQHCIRFLDISCALSEETSGILCDALENAESLEIFRIVLMSGRSSYVAGMLESLTGKAKLRELQVSDADANISESLSGLLSHPRCSLKDLSLSYDWSKNPPFDPYQFCGSLGNTRCNTVTQLQMDGINFEDDNLKDLPFVFPNLETLSISATEMPKLAFLDLQEDQLLQKLRHCYFPCTNLDVEEGRKLVEKLPNVVDIPDFIDDPVVEHFLDWTRCGRVIGMRNVPMSASLWPLILERTNEVLGEKPNRCANTMYNLLHDYSRMEQGGLLIFESNEDGYSSSGEEDEDW